jgi:hypothetical protein
MKTKPTGLTKALLLLALMGPHQRSCTACSKAVNSQDGAHLCPKGRGFVALALGPRKKVGG